MPGQLKVTLLDSPNALSKANPIHLKPLVNHCMDCLLYTSDAADE